MRHDRLHPNDRASERPTGTPKRSPLKPWSSRWIGAAIVSSILCTAVWGQDVGLGELRRMYEDVVAQLKAAQERKQELATQNESLLAANEALAGQVRRLESERERLTEVLASAEAKRVAAERETADLAARTWNDRSTLAAWEAFLALHRDVRQRWDAFLAGSGPLQSNGPGGHEPPATTGWLDRDWPLARD